CRAPAGRAPSRRHAGRRVVVASAAARALALAFGARPCFTLRDALLLALPEIGVVAPDVVVQLVTRSLCDVGAHWQIPVLVGGSGPVAGAVRRWRALAEPGPRG